MVFKKGEKAKNWNGFKKGYIPWNKGKHCSRKTKEKISEKMKVLQLGSNNTRYGIKVSKDTKVKMSKSHKGSKHWNWKGGITSYNLMLRESKRYKQWREAVFKRDNYTCQKPNCKYCNNKVGGSLESHHIVPFAECIALDFQELIFDIDNGMTLCKESHNGNLHKNIQNLQDQ